jgi:hypothetical protein
MHGVTFDCYDVEVLKDAARQAKHLADMILQVKRNAKRNDQTGLMNESHVDSELDWTIDRLDRAMKRLLQQQLRRNLMLEVKS